MSSATLASPQLVGRARKSWEDSVLEDDRLANSTDVFLVSTLLRYCQGKAVCWPTMGTLAEKMKMSQRTIYSSVKRLVKAGVLRLLKDTSLRQGRRFVIASHPDADKAAGMVKRTAKGASSPAVRCEDARQPLPCNTELKTDSSDSSLRSESSSSCRADDEGIEKIVSAVQTLLPPEDAADVIKEHRFLLRKAKGKPDLVLKAVDHARQHRSRVRRIVPYVITLIDSLVKGVPLFPVANPASHYPLPPDPPRNVVCASEEKRKWHRDYVERKQRLHSPPMAASF